MMNPVQITLINLLPSLLGRLKPVTVLDTYEGATKDFHNEGLYSTEIFGAIGSEARDATFSFIDLKTTIISPAYALTLYELKQLYKGIQSGARHAIWDEETKDFLPASAGDEGADTGYAFFMSHFKELTPKKSKSLIRNNNIALIDKFRDIAANSNVLVLPAGLRDLQIGTDGGRDKEDELNKLYRSLLAQARLVPEGKGRYDKSADKVRWSMQETFNEIYKYLFAILEGKGGFIRGKVAKRNIRHGTRNVLSSMNPVSPVIGRADEVRATDTFIGLYQGVKALEPIAINRIRTTYLEDIDGGPGKLWLVNKDTLKRELVDVSSEDYDKLITNEGIEGLINKFRDIENKHSPVRLAKHFVKLIWIGKDTFKIFNDIDDLPENLKRKDVFPLSYAELIYLSGYDVWNTYFIIPTRYPVAGDGSTYSSTLRISTTTTSSMKYELQGDWASKSEIPAVEFPSRDVAEFVSSMILAAHRLAGMTADFDGDTGSADSVMTDEALAENRERIDDVSYWIRPDGTLTMDVANDLVDRTVHNLMAE